MQIKAVCLSNRYIKNLRSTARGDPQLKPRRGVPHRNQAASGVGTSLLETYPRVSSGPLAELRLADVVDVDTDATDVALVYLDLMQVRGGMGAAPR